MKRRAFTITELIAAMVVLAIVVVITTPIVRKKMEKVNYAQYWMGYNAAQNIAKNTAFDDVTCDVEFGGHCWTLYSAYSPVTKAECEEMISMDIYGIKTCEFENDWWAGAVKKCGGIANMPALEQLAQLVQQIYGESIGTTENNNHLSIQDKKLYDTLLSKLSYPSSDFYFWSDTAYSSRGFLPVGSFYNQSLDGDASLAAAVCLNDVYEQLGLCEKIKDKFNTSDYDCTLANVNNSSDFENPHITFSNGLRLFIGSDFEELFPDAENESDRTGYKVYIDINGSKGKGILWEDVFPFYILKSGKVLAGYPNDAEVGGNNSEYLTANIMYDDYAGGNRKVKFLQFNADYKTAVCKAGIIKSAAYCGDVAVDNICKNIESDCRIKVKSPIKIF